ncbi:MAG: hypothetical protein A4S09_13935 [Proteobacteria bacterium SG_bin7]|nr:MAG: hypothetical protein A4S09_13935 [Proteobacteria bacterium SG_bin7]
MKLIKIFSVLFFIHAINLCWASECKEVTYSAKDYEFLADHENEMSITCLAAGKAALWSACVNCAANAKAGDSCKVGMVQSVPDEKNKVCNGFAEAKLNACAQGLVHCVDFTR